MRTLGRKCSVSKTFTLTGSFSGTLDARVGCTFSPGLNCLASYPDGVNANVELDIRLCLPNVYVYRRFRTLSGTLKTLHLIIHNGGNRGSRISGCIMRISANNALKCSRKRIVSSFGEVVSRIVHRRHLTEHCVVEGGASGLVSCFTHTLTLTSNTHGVSCSRSITVLRTIVLNLRLNVLRNLPTGGVFNVGTVVASYRLCGCLGDMNNLSSIMEHVRTGRTNTFHCHHPFSPIVRRKTFSFSALNVSETTYLSVLLDRMRFNSFPGKLFW